jgi:hypothetical protein
MTAVSQALKRLSVIDESLLSVPAESCSLYIQVAAPFISFCLFDRSRNKYVALCEYRMVEGNTLEELNSLVRQDEILSAKGYFKTGITVVSRKSVLVPLVFYRADEAAELLSLTSPVSSNETLCTDHLKYMDAVHLYIIDTALAGLLTELYPGCSIAHAGTVVMESELLRNKNNTEPSIAVNVRHGSYDIAVTTGMLLNYFNTFEFHGSEDFIYYLLFVMEQLKLNPEKVQVRFTGDIDRRAASYLITAKYIRNLSFSNRSEAFEYSYGFAQVPQHAHAVLLNQYLCES